MSKAGDACWRDPGKGCLGRAPRGGGAVLRFRPYRHGEGCAVESLQLRVQLDTLLGADLVADNDRVLLPLHHVYPFVTGMLAPLVVCLPIVMPRSLTARKMVRALRQEEVTALEWTKEGTSDGDQISYDGVSILEIDRLQSTST
jgi:hypothetical protein